MNTKSEFKWFFITDYEKEAKYLEEMHRLGWAFTNKSFLGWKFHFLQCRPDDMVYQVDYNPKALKNNPDYLKMFWDCGWESVYVTDGYVYFRKPKALMNGEEEIFCDAESRLDLMKRIIGGRMTVLLIVLLGTIIPQLIIHINEEGFSSAFAITFTIILLLYIAVFAIFGIKYKHLKDKLGK